MSFKFLLSLLLLLVVVVFSVQNAGVVRLRFLSWEFSASQALVVFLSASVGAGIGAVFSARARRRPNTPPPQVEPPPRTEPPPR